MCDIWFKAVRMLRSTDIWPYVYRKKQFSLLDPLVPVSIRIDKSDESGLGDHV